MSGAAILKQPSPDRLAAAVLHMEGARTYLELEIVCRNIEAQYYVEGITSSDREAYELVKAAHVRRVARGLVA